MRTLLVACGRISEQFSFAGDVLDRAARTARCVKLRDIRNGDWVVCGATGVRVQPPFKSREAKDFMFMANDVSSERRVEAP